MSLVKSEILPSEVLNALKAANGNRSKAANELGISRSNLVSIEDNFPEISIALGDYMEGILDLAEEKLKAKINTGHWPAIKFALETLGKFRGYSADSGKVIFNPSTGEKRLEIDLSNPEIRKRFLAITDSIANSARDDGELSNPGRMGDGKTFEIDEP